MDGKQFIKLNAEEILKCLLSHDQEIVRAYFEQEKRDAYKEAKLNANILGTMGATLIITLGLGAAIFIGIGMFTTSTEQTRYDALKAACIERVLCTCKDLPVEEP